MDRDRAVNITKEIQIPELSPQGIAIMESENTSISTGCTINITGVNKDYREKIKQVIKDCCLEANEGDNYIIIYTPKILNEKALS